MTSLTGIHAVVTGGGTGIGAAIARRLAAEGALLTLVGRRIEPLRAVAAPLGAMVAPADVTDPEAVAKAFERARAAHGPIAMLINNAGAASSAPFARTSLADWRAMTAINLDSLYICTHAALTDLKAAPMARIVTIASTAGVKGYAYTCAYCAAKHGAIGFTRALAAELATSAITVNAVCPGFTDTDLVAGAVAGIVAKTRRSAEDARAELARFNPQGRLIEPAEVANTVAWLCHPDSGSITGQSIIVAGGEAA
ncbi:SDR family oxidoreductase [Sphingomonas sp. So64.6b]|uniref:SDR family NAD(P)-dependent oxidoreductase n=1 Tax=Sphingomonas sp. So64.6b TaxID=2997354 RepID=UPI0016006305|nr:SDR family NAD(P)-dependent oxidoreductase [Sphingomonas sp. So64.6b]QNA85292.1 SDR family oxidoreductase [Sphingomonas sp. So64.6b]